MQRDSHPARPIGRSSWPRGPHGCARAAARPRRPASDLVHLETVLGELSAPAPPSGSVLTIEPNPLVVTMRQHSSPSLDQAVGRLPHHEAAFSALARAGAGNWPAIWLRG